MEPFAQELATRLAGIRNVNAVTLGGSRAIGSNRPDSDWDFGLYYRDVLDPEEVRALGYPGTVVAPGDWAYPMNGGAWLRVDDRKVDILYRDLDEVERWTAEAREGTWDLFRMPGYLCGMPSYALVAEASLSTVLEGALEQTSFPEALAVRGPRKWLWEAEFALTHAAAHAERDDRAACVGKCAFAILCVAQARMLQRREWVLNEKGVVALAGLASAEALLQREDLPSLVDGVGAALEVTRS